MHGNCCVSPPVSSEHRPVAADRVVGRRRWAASVAPVVVIERSDSV